MSATTSRLGGEKTASGLLDRKRIVADADFNRWLAPPAALAIHLCIGMAYGFSVFWLPLSREIGGSKPLACPAGSSIFTALFTTSCDWLVADLSWVFTLFIFFLGVAAALWGGWLERAGPRKAGVAAAVCWSGGLLLGALGIVTHQLWILWLGTGVLGGIGLGLGYISPVSTLIKWFPDRRGMATGMAIMGFGGGAMIGAPLAQMLMEHFRAPGSGGVWQTFVVLAAIYFVFMMGGAFGYRVPPPGWQPAGWTPPEPNVKAMITHGQVHLRDAHKTMAFWCVWLVLCMNVSAGIGVLSMASPMLQEIFGGSLIGSAGHGVHGVDGCAARLGGGDRGRVRRAAVAGQYRRALLLGLGVGPYRAEGDVFHLLPAGDRDVRGGPLGGACRQHAAVRRVLLRDPVDVRRRVRDGAGVPGRSVRGAVRRGDSWAAADGVVHRRDHRAGAGQLYAGGGDLGWRASVVGV